MAPVTVVDEVWGDGMNPVANEGPQRPAGHSSCRRLLRLLYVVYVIYVVAILAVEIHQHLTTPMTLSWHFGWFDAFLLMTLLPGVVLAALVLVVAGGSQFDALVIAVSIIVGCALAPLAVGAVIRRRKARRRND